MQTIKIGTRGSKLAIAQTKIVENLLQKYFPDIKTEIVIIKTKGDKILDKPLSEIGDKGLFINEFEDALINKEIDLAIHSAKDLPTQLKRGLKIICTPKRADARDVIITKKGSVEISLIGTSSPRREFYAKKYYPNAICKPIRGNIDTRLNKLLNGEYDAIILAKAGLDRLNIIDNNLDLFDFKIFDIKTFLPAACQGIIAVETREDYEFNNQLLLLNEYETCLQYKIERECLKNLEISCSEISAVYSEILSDDEVSITVMYKGKEISVKENTSKILKKIPSIVSQVKL